MIQGEKTLWVGTSLFVFFFCLRTVFARYFRWLHMIRAIHKKNCDSQKMLAKLIDWRQRLNNAKDINNGLRILSSIKSLLSKKKKNNKIKFNAIYSHILSSIFFALYWFPFFSSYFQKGVKKTRCGWNNHVFFHFLPLLII